MTDEFVETLRGIDLDPTGYVDGLTCVIEGLSYGWKTQDPVKHKYLEGLQIWNDIFVKLGA
jgi:hypothetical protein